MLGSKFVVKTENTDVGHFFSQPRLMPKQARWHKCLFEFDFQFLYNSGISNRVTDALSRKLEIATLIHIAQLSRSVVETILKGRILEELLKDP